ncbi:hypothetical protein YC2023_108130 [Brassica napus]
MLTARRERERWRGEREERRRRGEERERRDAAKREKEERGSTGRERESRGLGLPVSGNSLQGFASKLSDGRLRGKGFVFIGEARKPLGPAVLIDQHPLWVLG